MLEPYEYKLANIPHELCLDIDPKAYAFSEQLLLRNGLHVNRRLSVPKSATDCNGFLPVMLDNNFHHLGMLGVQQKLEEHSKLLFADQEEAGPVWERHGEGQQQGDDMHQQQQPEQEVWQHRQRTQQQPLKARKYYN